MWSEQHHQGFSGVLQEFQHRFNSNPRARKLVTDWNRCVLLDALNTGSKFSLTIQDCSLADVKQVDSYDDGDDGLVLLQAEENVLMDIFSGRYNPATALTDGNLAVFSRDRDKVKLEALAMVIWRLG